jgi:hypothetical protein
VTDAATGRRACAFGPLRTRYGCRIIPA